MSQPCGDADMRRDAEKIESPNGLFLNGLRTTSTHFCNQCGARATMVALFVDAKQVVWKKKVCDRCGEKLHEDYMKKRAEDEALNKIVTEQLAAASNGNSSNN